MRLEGALVNAFVLQEQQIVPHSVLYIFTCLLLQVLLGSVHVTAAGRESYHSPRRHIFLQR